MNGNKKSDCKDLKGCSIMKLTLRIFAFQNILRNDFLAKKTTFFIIQVFFPPFFNLITKLLSRISYT